MPTLIGGSAGGGDGWVIESTVAISADATINFTDLSSSVEHQFCLEDIVPSADTAAPQFRASIDNGENYLASGEYERAIRTHNAGGTTGNLDDVSQNQITLGVAAGTGTGENFNMTLTLPNIGGSLYKVVEVFGKSYTANGNFQFVVGGGSVNTTSAINAVQFLITSGNYASGTIIHRTRPKS